MKAVLDQVKDKNVRVYRRYGVRSVEGLEQPQEEEVTYILSEDASHNYTVKLPDEDTDSWWLIASITNAFSVGSRHQGHTPIFQTPPHLSPPVDEVKLVSKEDYEKLLAEIDKRIEAKEKDIREIPENFVDDRAILKEELIAEVKKTGEISKDSLLKLLENF
jgi:hypothetical protein